MSTDTDTRTIYNLARLADCADPDSAESPGGLWLRRVEGSTVERLEWNGANDESTDPDDMRDDDQLAEIADGSVPIYTGELWAVFVDVGGYREDLDDLGGASNDMDQNARMALFMIAERLVHAIIEESAEQVDDTDTEGV